jgi:DME family drug/metabolite transporter
VGYFLVGEPLTRSKWLALAITLGGCALVARVYLPETLQVQGLGLLTGLGAGFTYGMYSVFGKFGLRRYNPWVVQAYSLVAGALMLLALYGREAVGALVAAPDLWPQVLYMGLVPTVLAYGIYLTGLQSIESSHASIVATVEPVVAALLGLVLLAEPVAWPQVVGMVLVLAGVVVLQRAHRRQAALDSTTP